MTEKLSERVEAHNGGDSWPLRVDIAEALGWTSKPVGGVIAWYAPEEPDVMKAGPPKWLTSLDAAMSLVPEGANSGDTVWNVEGWSSNGVHAPHVRATAWVAGAPRVYAATPALALCAAALKARGL